MAQDALQARRVLIKLLLALSAVYGVVLGLWRDSCDADVNKGFKKAFLKAHPDKGGSEQHAKELNEAKERWEKAKKPNGRPMETRSDNDSRAKSGNASFQDLVMAQEDVKSAFRIHSSAVLLTYVQVADLARWRRFVAHVAGK